MLAFTGIRGGEALALDCETDIDFNQQKLSISKTVTRTKDGFEIGPPKTKSSYRTIRLDNKTCQIFKKSQLHQKEFFFQSNIKNKNIVFASFEGEHATRQSFCICALKGPPKQWHCDTRSETYACFYVVSSWHRYERSSRNPWAGFYRNHQ